MLEESVTFPLGSLRVYAYGLFVAAGAIAAGALLLFLCRGDKRRSSAASLTFLLSLPLGLLCARLAYCLGDASFREVASLKAVLDLSTGGFSMYGAFAGFVLAALAGAGAIGVKRAGFLDTIVPALMSFVFFARLGEGYTALGISRPLVSEVMKNSFLAFRGEYDAYLRTYLLEAAAALVLGAALWRILAKAHRPGDVFLSWMLLYGAAQTLFESLRYDYHMRLSFVGIQQLLSAAMLSAAVAVFALRLLRQRRCGRLAWFSLLLLPFILAALIGLEFMLDRSAVSKALLYAAYAVLLAAPAALGVAMRERGKADG